MKLKLVDKKIKEMLEKFGGEVEVFTYDNEEENGRCYDIEIEYRTFLKEIAII